MKELFVMKNHPFNSLAPLLRGDSDSRVDQHDVTGDTYSIALQLPSRFNLMGHSKAKTGCNSDGHQRRMCPTSAD
jgi:hypothetical protein